MVLGILTTIGVTFIAGYFVANVYQSAKAEQDWDDQQRNRVDELQHRLKELNEERSRAGCWYVITLILVFTFLITLGIILYTTNFFRSKKRFATLLSDWEYWLDYENYRIFNYNYPGIVGVAVTMVLVVVLLIILCKLCWDVKKQENEHKDICEELQKIQEQRSNRGGIAYAQGGLISIAIDRINCLNVHSTCYISIITSLAFISVIAFTCYVMHTYFFNHMYIYPGVVTMVFAVFLPFFISLCTLCLDVRRQENEHEIREELQHLQQDQCIAYAQGGVQSCSFHGWLTHHEISMLVHVCNDTITCIHEN